jgi:hypothetical protein
LSASIEPFRVRSQTRALWRCGVRPAATGMTRRPGSAGSSGSDLSTTGTARTRSHSGRPPTLPCFYDAFDKLVGPGRWQPRPNVGNFVVRFPSHAEPGDLGWRIDVSFPGETGDPEGRDYSAWRVNITSRDRAPLMLFLFSDVRENDAPTRIRVGFHFDVAQILARAGEAGMAHLRLADAGAERDIALATGEAGTVYLCNPFLIHGAQKHCGAAPRFMSQPPLAPATSLRLERANGAYSPVEIAILEALQKTSFVQPDLVGRADC